MEQPRDDQELKFQVIAEIGKLSRLLGQIPGDDEIIQQARESFLRLSIMVGQALGLNLQ
ncbi:MAG: hypothetical protein JSW16_01955 [Dehalococcoidales bacterium]|nr:MAG: hypothetical protein JSW16_01955 [Dehalococcoidales bacterium]